MELRPYQRAALDAANAAYARGKKRVCIVIPTGGGKTATAVEAAIQHVKAGGRCLWLAHRVELVDQAADTFRRRGFEVGIISAQRPELAANDRPITVASVQTLAARGERPPADLVIQDEAHTVALAAGWQEVSKHYSQARVLGLTATPTRGDGVGLGAWFEDLVVGATIGELVEGGYLVPLEIHAPEKPLPADRIATDPVDAYKRYADGARAIVFAPNLKSVHEFTARFQQRGVAAAAVTGECGSSDRERALRQFREGELSVLVNQNVLVEGFDVPSTSCVILARGCGHPGLLVQMTGRGMRPAPGKTKCVLVDLRGVTHVHGRPDEDYEYSLEGMGMRAPGHKGQSFCLLCGTPVEKTSAVCSICGRERPELIVPRSIGKALLRQEKMRRIPDQRRVYMLAQWIKQTRAKKWNPRAPYARYKATFGHYPPAEVVSLANDVANRSK